VDAKFLSFGCAANIATASITTEMIKGKTVDEAEKINLKQIADNLDGLPVLKMHCAVLAYKTLKKALQEYRKKKL
jgi:nitrogen fixation NifU-like protein